MGSNFNHQQLPCPQITQISTDNNAMPNNKLLITINNHLITPKALLTHEVPTNLQRTQ
jgi:hypothetical protein